MSPKRRRIRNIFGGAAARESPKAMMPTAESSKEADGSSFSFLKVYPTGVQNDSQQEARRSWGMPRMEQPEEKN